MRRGPGFVVAAVGGRRSAPLCPGSIKFADFRPLSTRREVGVGPHPSARANDSTHTFDHDDLLDDLECARYIESVGVVMDRKSNPRYALECSFAPRERGCANNSSECE
ncbi:hypothetical protein ACNOYE_26590 [Nannocystaceae bacterium ST9]